MRAIRDREDVDFEVSSELNDNRDDEIYINDGQGAEKDGHYVRLGNQRGREQWTDV